MGLFAWPDLPITSGRHRRDRVGGRPAAVKEHTVVVAVASHVVALDLDQLLDRAVPRDDVRGAARGRSRRRSGTGRPGTAARRRSGRRTTRTARAPARRSSRESWTASRHGPVFRACSKSNASPPRTSPTMMRSGRWRSVARSSSRMVTAGRSACSRRASKRTRFGPIDLQLRGVLDEHDAIVAGQERRERVQERRLAGARAAADQDVLVALDRRLRRVASTSGVIVPIRTSSSAVKNRV